MRVGATGHVRAALGNHGAPDNHGRPALFLPGLRQSAVDCLVIMAVHLKHVPVITFKTLTDIIAVGEVG